MSQSKMKPCLVHPSNPEWERQIKSWKLSGLSKAEYCRRKHISYHTFNYWKKRLKISQPPSPITLVKLEEPKEITSSFHKQKVISLSPIRFWVKDFCIEVENNFSSTVLGQLVQTLRRI
jgi:hypothetical protein